MDGIKYCPLISATVGKFQYCFKEQCAWYLDGKDGNGKCVICKLVELERAANMLQGIDKSLYEQGR